MPHQTYTAFQLAVYPALELSPLSLTLSFDNGHDLLIALDSMARLLLFTQDTLKAMPDYSNVFEISVKWEADGTWIVLTEEELREALE